MLTQHLFHTGDAQMQHVLPGVIFVKDFRHHSGFLAACRESTIIRQEHFGQSSFIIH